ncbi:MAG: carbohydrate-binding protein, partial [Puniceicoccaceae bacterium]
ERFKEKNGSVNKGWFISNLHGGCWMRYPDLELGREKPFEQMTIRYGTNSERAGCRIRVLLNPTIEGQGDKRKLNGGEEIGVFVVESTSGWETFKEFTQPVKISKPGKHDLFLVLEQGDSKAGNALVNIDWFELSFAKP